MGREGFARAVVTGGAGFLGSHLCERLLERGTSVLCLDNLLTGSPRNMAHLCDDPEFEFVECDVTAPLPVRGPVDLVVHMASPASPVDYRRFPIETMRVGSLGTTNALDLAERHGARFLLTSTSEVYGDPRVHPQPESYWGNVNPVGPRAVYDEAKRYSEALTTAYRSERGVRTRIARIFNCYGPRMRRDDGRMVPTFAGQALAGRPLTVAGSGAHTRSLCYVEDTVAGLLALAGSDCPRPVNIGSPRELPVLAWAEMVRDLARARVPIEHGPAVPDDPGRRCPDITLARTALGWEPHVEPENGLRRTLSWFAELSRARRPAGV